MRRGIPCDVRCHAAWDFLAAEASFLLQCEQESGVRDDSELRLVRRHENLSPIIRTLSPILRTLSLIIRTLSPIICTLSPTLRILSLPEW